MRMHGELFVLDARDRLKDRAVKCPDFTLALENPREVGIGQGTTSYGYKVRTGRQHFFHSLRCVQPAVCDEHYFRRVAPCQSDQAVRRFFERRLPRLMLRNMNEVRAGSRERAEDHFSVCLAALPFRGEIVDLALGDPDAHRSGVVDGKLDSLYDVCEQLDSCLRVAPPTIGSAIGLCRQKL